MIRSTSRTPFAGRGPARPRASALSRLLLPIFALISLPALATPPQLTSAVSRMTQGTATFDIQLPLSGGTGVECRNVGGGVTIVLNFDQAVTSGNASATAPATTTVLGFAGTTMSVRINGINDATLVTLTVTDVTNAAAETLPSAAVNFRAIYGDVNANGSVSGADVNIAKTQVGFPITGANFRCDVQGNGSISGADVTVIKSRVGVAMSGGKTSNSSPTISNIADQNTAVDTATLPVGFAVGDGESAADTLDVSGSSSNQVVVPDSGVVIGGSGGSRTVQVTPAAGQTGNAIITVRVSDGLTSTIDTFVVSVGSATKLYIATLRPPAGFASMGSGTSTLLMSGDETWAAVRVSYANLSTTKTGLEIRGPADEGQQGNILFNINTTVPEADGSYKWVFADVGTTTTAQIIEAIKAGRTYLNVDTTKYAAGEIRGQYGYATGSQTFTAPPAPPALPGGPPTPEDAQRFLTQATFGPTSDEINNVVAMGFDAWLNQQFNTPKTSVYNEFYNRVTTSTAESYAGARITEIWWKNALTCPDQLRQRVATAYCEIFVVSRVEDAIEAQSAGLATYHDMLADDAFANFRKLLEDVTLHPIMGQYLNMRGNKKQTSPTSPVPNENYAREVLQLFSIGLNALHPDGTLKLDASGLPIPTYGQSEIQEFAQVFTGWDVDAVGVNIPTLTVDGVVVQTSTYNKPMLVKSANHSNEQKVLLNGFTIAANANQTTISSNAELAVALDNIFFHPNVGPFICRRLIQRLVTSNPSPAYIYRVASVFADDGTGVRGNMQAVIRAILTDYEARSTDLLGNAGYGKVREPLLRASAVIRAFHPSSPNGKWKLDNTDTQLGQTIYRSPTVFNFFEPDFVARGEGGLAGLFAPEMQIITETTAITAANYIYSGVYTTSGWQGGDVRLNLATEQALVDNTAEVTQLVGTNLNLLLMANQMPAAMRDRIMTYVNGMANTSTTDKLNRARAAVHLVVSSAQFNNQR